MVRVSKIKLKNEWFTLLVPDGSLGNVELYVYERLS